MYVLGIQRKNRPYKIKRIKLTILIIEPTKNHVHKKNMNVYVHNFNLMRLKGEVLLLFIPWPTTVQHREGH